MPPPKAGRASRGYFVPGEGFIGRLEMVILDRRLTYRLVEEKTRISHETFRQWRRGESFPNRMLLYHFCKTFGIQLNVLLYGNAPEKPARRTKVTDRRLTHLFRSLEIVDHYLDHMTKRQLDDLLKRLGDTRQRIRDERERQNDPMYALDCAVRSGESTNNTRPDYNERRQLAEDAVVKNGGAREPAF